MAERTDYDQNPDELLADLDEEVSLDAITATSNSTQPAELDELDTLLADSMQAVAERNAVKAARKRLAAGGLSREDYSRDNELVARWAELYEWESVATCGVFNRYNCACGKQHITFDSLMVEQLHRQDKFSRRWVNPELERRAAPMAKPLARKTIVREHQVQMCDNCATWKGWDLSAFQETWTAGRGEHAKL